MRYCRTCNKLAILVFITILVFGAIQLIGTNSAYADTAGAVSCHVDSKRAPVGKVTVDYDAPSGTLTFSGSGTVGGLRNRFYTDQLPDSVNAEKILVDVKKL